jgi:hypothetical protein
MPLPTLSTIVVVGAIYFNSSIIANVYVYYVSVNGTLDQLYRTMQHRNVRPELLVARSQFVKFLGSGERGALPRSPLQAAPSSPDWAPSRIGCLQKLDEAHRR